MKTLLVTAIALATIASAPAAAFTVGAPGIYGNCAPFGCVVRYQQAYSASLFSGPLSITSLTFYDQTNYGQQISATGYTISLSTAATGVGSLSGHFDDNLGADNALFFSGNLSGPTAPSFTIAGTAFNYDPSMGDLLLDVVKTGGNNDFSAFIDYRADFAGFQRVYAFSSTTDGSVNDNYGLVTGFNGAVPEPATWALMLVGFGFAGSALRRRGSVAA